MDEFDVDPVLGLLTLALGSEVNFSVVEERCLVPFIFEDSLSYDFRSFEDPERSFLKHSEVPVRYWDRSRVDTLTLPSRRCHYTNMFVMVLTCSKLQVSRNSLSW